MFLKLFFNKATPFKNVSEVNEVLENFKHAFFSATAARFYKQCNRNGYLEGITYRQ
jgi:hypothetical protein